MTARKTTKSQAKAFRQLAGQIISKQPTDRDPLIVYGTIANLLAGGLDKAFLADDPLNIVSRQYVAKIAAILNSIPSSGNNVLAIHLLVFLVVCILKHEEVFRQVKDIAIAEGFLKPLDEIEQIQTETAADTLAAAAQADQS